MGCMKLLSVFLAFAAVDARAIFNRVEGKDVIPDSYVVVMKDGVSAQDFESHVSWVTEAHTTNSKKRDSATSGVKFNYDIDGWRGYSGHFDEATVEEILNNGKVMSRLHFVLCLDKKKPEENNIV